MKLLEVEFVGLKGPLLVTSERFFDHRGFFEEEYNVARFEDIGIPPFVQDNISESKKNVFRGLHWQTAPMAQGKLVTCLNGAILDVLVDIRRTSPTFGKQIEVELDDATLKSLWVPEGFAHGFLSRTDKALVHYKTTNYWSQAHEKSMKLVDLDSKILGSAVNSLIRSQKDLDAPSFQDLVQAADELFF